MSLLSAMPHDVERTYDANGELVLKNADRIERVEVLLESRSHFQLFTTTFVNFMRDDFYYLSCVIYFAFRYPERDARVRRHVSSLSDPVVALEYKIKTEFAKDFNVPLAATNIGIRLISADMARIMRIIKRADNCNALLLQAQTRGVISGRERTLLMRPIKQALHYLKLDAAGYDLDEFFAEYAMRQAAHFARRDAAKSAQVSA